jgi:hypothetical protein
MLRYTKSNVLLNQTEYDSREFPWMLDMLNIADIHLDQIWRVNFDKYQVNTEHNHAHNPCLLEQLIDGDVYL